MTVCILAVNNSTVHVNGRNACWLRLGLFVLSRRLFLIARPVYVEIAAGSTPR